MYNFATVFPSGTMENWACVRQIYLSTLSTLWLFLSPPQPSHTSLTHAVYNGFIIPVTSKGICIDCENPYSGWDEHLHYQNYYLKLCHGNNYRTTTELAIFGLIIQGKGQIKPLTKKFNYSCIIYLLAHIQNNSAAIKWWSLYIMTLICSYFPGLW